MVQVNTSVELKGPLFKEGISFIDDAAEAAVQELMEDGESRLDETLRTGDEGGVFLTVQQAGKRKSVGDYRRGVSGVRRRLHALISDGGKVYGPWLEGTSPKNKTSRFKGYAQFRKTKDWLQKRAKKTLQRHVARAVKRLNGR